MVEQHPPDVHHGTTCISSNMTITRCSETKGRNEGKSARKVSHHNGIPTRPSNLSLCIPEGKQSFGWTTFHIEIDAKFPPETPTPPPTSHPKLHCDTFRDQPSVTKSTKLHNDKPWSDPKKTITFLSRVKQDEPSGQKAIVSDWIKPPKHIEATAITIGKICNQLYPLPHPFQL